MANANSTALTKTDAFDFKHPPFWAWNYASAKGYMGGCESGGAAAIAYIKHVEKKEYYYGYLQNAAIDMAEILAKTEPHSAEYDAITLLRFYR